MNIHWQKKMSMFAYTCHNSPWEIKYVMQRFSVPESIIILEEYSSIYSILLYQILPGIHCFLCILCLKDAQTLKHCPKWTCLVTFLHV